MNFEKMVNDNNKVILKYTEKDDSISFTIYVNDIVYLNMQRSINNKELLKILYNNWINEFNNGILEFYITDKYVSYCGGIDNNWFFEIRKRISNHCYLYDNGVEDNIEDARFEAKRIF